MIINIYSDQIVVELFNGVTKLLLCDDVNNLCDDVTKLCDDVTKLCDDITIYSVPLTEILRFRRNFDQ